MSALSGRESRGSARDVRFTSSFGSPQLQLQLDIVKKNYFKQFLRFGYVLCIRSISTIGKRFYIGQTQNIENRLNRHNSRLEKSTSAYVPWELVLTISKENRSASIILEKKLKNLNTEDLLKFIQKYGHKTQ